MRHLSALIAAASIGGVCLALTPAQADQDSYDQAMTRCQTFAEDNNVSADPCECIAKAVSDDPDLMKEDSEIKTMDDFQNASQAYKDAVNPCVPPENQAQ